MELDDIIEVMTLGVFLPEAALAAAQLQKTAVTARLLDLLAAEVAEPGEGEADLSAPLLLLAEWQEQRAFALVCELMTCPADLFEAIFEEAVSNHLDAVLAQLYDGNPRPLFEGVVNGDIDEEASVAFLGALVRLVHQDRIEPAALETFLDDIYPIVSENDASFIGHAWTHAVSALGFTRLEPKAKKLFDDGSLINLIGTYQHFQADLKAALHDPDSAFSADAPYYQPLTSALDVMKSWHWPVDDLDDDGNFIDDSPDEPSLSAEMSELGHSARIEKVLQGAASGAGATSTQPVHVPNRDVGRNDPCPCGSGKKYKKCCLQS